MRLVLASSSPYRANLLKRLQLPFEAKAPDIDETPLAEEQPEQLVARLARHKAQALAEQYANALIVAADQVAAIKRHILGKPEDLAAARRQLRLASGQRVDFITGLCLLDTSTGRSQEDQLSFSVFFRPLTNAMINRYLEIENPLDCTASFRSEGLGIALVERMQGDDPSALIGLPLIRLLGMLEAAGVWPLPRDASLPCGD